MDARRSVPLVAAAANRCFALALSGGKLFAAGHSWNLASMRMLANLAEYRP